ncbi:unnamed protein product [Adineta steineri]|uniref:Guanylate cyclase domain-containing protein n=1 Tax=Adineta steineri TaxID=433720 RepID=A0A818NTS4_9BILA|nr:unnamed protein product [Adineta steineri]
MAYDDSQTINCALLGTNSPYLKHNKMHQNTSLTPNNKLTRDNLRWTDRASSFSASFRRYRSPFRRNGMNTSSINSQYVSPPSFPLFRHFYLMRSSLRHKRKGLFRNNTIAGDSLLSDKFHITPRIESHHVIMTLFITIASALLLIFMIFLDLAYLNDAIPNVIKHQTIINKNTLCFYYPKVCVMKGLVIIIFIAITTLLCYSILTLYTRARSHTLLLERKTDELEKEKCLTQKLLHQILPPCVAKDLINGRKAPAEYFDSVTVYFSDIVGFTNIASMCSPNETCDMLNQLYSTFDSLLENFDVYKVETIGDAYMVVSGAPTKNGDKHPNEIVNMSLSLIRGKQQVRVPRTFAELQLRIGIHTGPVCAAVIGSKMPRYCMFGDTVNVANRMESTGVPERIHISDDTYKRLKNPEQYIFEERGEIDIKGKGLMRTYFLLDRKSRQSISRSRTNTLFDKDP